MLADVDPELASTIHPNHSRRIARALEVYLASGVTMSEWRRRQATRDGLLSDRFRVTQLAIRPADRTELHARIERRVDAMLASGFVEEVRSLRDRGDLRPDLPAIRAVGYRQLWGHRDGEYDLARARELIVHATRQLAKRQLTWLRGWPQLHWIYTDAAGRALPATGGEPGPPLASALPYLQAVSIDSR
jgi:tRNA dimethylallyltransferase